MYLFPDYVSMDEDQTKHANLDADLVFFRKQMALRISSRVTQKLLRSCLAHKNFIWNPKRFMIEHLLLVNTGVFSRGFLLADPY